MDPIKVEVSVKLNLSEDTKNFVKSLFIGAAAPAAPVTKAPAASAAPAAEEAPAAGTAAGTAAGEAAEVSIEDVRKALATKVNNHRAEIKDKLEELGAPSVTKLDPEKYPIMLEFLNSLD